MLHRKESVLSLK